MSFIDDLAARTNRHAPATGAPIDLERGRKASRKIGLLHGLSIVGAITFTAGIMAFGAALFTMAPASLLLGFGVLALGGATMQGGLAGVNRVFRTHGEHINAYLDRRYSGRRPERLPEEQAEQEAAATELKAIADKFNNPAAVTTMKPLKFQPPKPKDAQP